MIEFGNEDTRAYSLIQKLIKCRLLDTIPDIMFEDFISQNQSQRVESMQKFTLQLAIENANEEDEDDIGAMLRAAKVLRKCIANFIFGRKTEFQWSVKNDIGDIYATLQ